MALIPSPSYDSRQSQTGRDKDENKSKNDMKIATLQFAPKLGDTQGNIQRADELLRKGGRGTSITTGKDVVNGSGIEGLKPDVLVLSEMALTG